MTIEVQLFGPQAALVGERRLSVNAQHTQEDHLLAKEVLRAVGEAAPELTASLATSRLAVNHEFATDETPIRPGDEVALIGMVSGG